VAKKKIYIAGPMRGIPLYNFPAFDQAAWELKDLGYCPISPTDIDRQYGFDPRDLPQPWDWTTFPKKSMKLQDVIMRDVVAILQCDGVLMLPGHLDSAGAIAEKRLALWAGIPVFYEIPHVQDYYQKESIP
jgi:hypothetical protein